MQSKPHSQTQSQEQQRGPPTPHYQPRGRQWTGAAYKAAAPLSGPKDTEEGTPHTPHPHPPPPTLGKGREGRRRIQSPLIRAEGRRTLPPAERASCDGPISSFHHFVIWLRGVPRGGHPPVTSLPVEGQRGRNRVKHISRHEDTVHHVVTASVSPPGVGLVYCIGICGPAGAYRDPCIGRCTMAFLRMVQASAVPLSPSTGHPVALAGCSHWGPHHCFGVHCRLLFFEASSRWSGGGCISRCRDDCVHGSVWCSIFSFGIVTAQAGGGGGLTVHLSVHSPRTARHFCQVPAFPRAKQVQPSSAWHPAAWGIELGTIQKNAGVVQICCPELRGPVFRLHKSVQHIFLQVLDLWPWIMGP